VRLLTPQRLTRELKVEPHSLAPRQRKFVWSMYEQEKATNGGHGAGGASAGVSEALAILGGKA